MRQTPGTGRSTAPCPGDPPAAMNLAEVDAAVAVLDLRAYSAAEIGERLRVTSRTVVRARHRNRARAEELVDA